MRQKITMAYVEKYIAKHPDKKNIRSALGDYTYFNRDADENGQFPGEVKPGCLFGHIIASLGGGPDDVREGRNITADLNQEALSKKLSVTERDILQNTQYLADRHRLEWAEAWQKAKSWCQV